MPPYPMPVLPPPSSLLPALLKTGGLYYQNQGSLSGTLQYLNQFASQNPSCLWISEEGYLYPFALTEHCQIPFFRFLLIKTPSTKETWRLSLEAIQTGLFDIAVIRPSKSCDSTHWRRLQLASEKINARVFFVGKVGIPHWVLKNGTENHNTPPPPEISDEKNPILSKSQLLRNIRGSLPQAYAKLVSF